MSKAIENKRSQEDCAEQFLTYSEAAELLGISTKTLQRWQERGLKSHTFVNPRTNRDKTGFLRSDLEQFGKENPGVLEYGRRFSRTSDEDVESILGDVESGESTKLAAETHGRSRQTIYNILARKEKRKQDK